MLKTILKIIFASLLVSGSTSFAEPTQIKSQGQTTAVSSAASQPSDPAMVVTSPEAEQDDLGFVSDNNTDEFEENALQEQLNALLDIWQQKITTLASQKTQLSLVLAQNEIAQRQLEEDLHQQVSNITLILTENYLREQDNPLLTPKLKQELDSTLDDPHAKKLVATFRRQEQQIKDYNEALGKGESGYSSRGLKLLKQEQQETAQNISALLDPVYDKVINRGAIADKLNAGASLIEAQRQRIATMQDTALQYDQKISDVTALEQNLNAIKPIEIPSKGVVVSPYAKETVQKYNENLTEFKEIVERYMSEGNLTVDQFYSLEDLVNYMGSNLASFDAPPKTWWETFTRWAQSIGVWGSKIKILFTSGFKESPFANSTEAQENLKSQMTALYQQADELNTLVKTIQTEVMEHEIPQPIVLSTDLSSLHLTQPPDAHSTDSGYSGSSGVAHPWKTPEQVEQSAIDMLDLQRDLLEMDQAEDATYLSEAFRSDAGGLTGSSIWIDQLARQAGIAPAQFHDGTVPDTHMFYELREQQIKNYTTDYNKFLSVYNEKIQTEQQKKLWKAFLSAQDKYYQQTYGSAEYQSASDAYSEAAKNLKEELGEVSFERLTTVKALALESYTRAVKITNLYERSEKFEADTAKSLGMQKLVGQIQRGAGISENDLKALGLENNHTIADYNMQVCGANHCATTDVIHDPESTQVSPPSDLPPYPHMHEPEPIFEPPIIDPEPIMDDGGDE